LVQELSLLVWGLVRWFEEEYHVQFVLDLGKDVAHFRGWTLVGYMKVCGNVRGGRGFSVLGLSVYVERE
jgi:hypothetical protein